MTFFKKDELKLLWPFYLDAILSPMLFFAPAFFVVYFNYLALSYFQIGMLFAIMPLVSLLFEIPTGAVADLHGRKFSVLLGYLLEGFAFFSLFFLKEYYLMLAAFAFLGFASTFSSGSKEAWIADLIKKEDKSLMHRYFSKAQSFDSFGLIISGLLGAFLVARIGVSIIWPFASASFLASFLILAFAREEYAKRKVKIRDSLKDLFNQTRKSASYSYKHHVLFYFLLAGFVALFSLNLQTNISWIPLLQSLGMPDYAFGYLWSMMAVVIMISPLLATKLLKKGKEKNFIILGMVLCVLVTSLILFAYNLALAVAVMLGALLFYFAKRPAERVYFHKFIPSKLRATIGSIESLILSVAGIISLPLAGLLVDKIGARYTIFISALVMIPAIIIYFCIKEKELK